MSFECLEHVEVLRSRQAHIVLEVGLQVPLAYLDGASHLR